MALFSITRYLGNEDSTVTAVSKSQENEILSRLHKEAKSRLLANKVGDSRKRTASIESEETPTPSGKKRKRISEDDFKKSDQNEDVSEVTELSNESADVATKRVGSSDVGGFTILGEAKQHKLKAVKRMLPAWLSHPSIVSSNIKADRVRVKDVTGIDKQMVSLLRQNGIKKLFPVQAQVIPALLRGTSQWLHLTGTAGCRPQDICCSAPTGSGKTLAYVVPVVQILKSRVVRRIRCLVVVPVGDLAAQVHRVFTDYCQHTDLRVGLLTGLRPFAQEQFSLVKRGPRGYYSMADIVVCTPGRLVDHITKTAGFDLTHLRYLIIDEADRVVEEIKQDWLSLVEKAVYQEPSSHEDSIYLQSCRRLQTTAMTAENLLRPQIPLQKLLFSATLSQDPEILNQLKLFQPVLFTAVVKSSVSKVKNSETKPKSKPDKLPLSASVAEETEGEFLDKLTTPLGLTERFVECSKSQKPLALLYLLCQMQFKHVLCFTNSVDSTHRLYQLMKLIGRVTVKEFSSNLKPVRRNRILKQFAAGKIQLLISTDATSRGIDVADIDCVVSYDVPRALTTYVHRAGRTARAGRPGTAFTLLEKTEIFHFKKLLRLAGKTGVKEIKLKQSDLKPYVDPVKTALKNLPAVLQTEKKTTNNKK